MSWCVLLWRVKGQEPQSCSARSEVSNRDSLQFNIEAGGGARIIIIIMILIVIIKSTFEWFVTANRQYKNKQKFDNFILSSNDRFMKKEFNTEILRTIVGAHLGSAAVPCKLKT